VDGVVEVQDWVRKQEVEDPVGLKSRDRVSREVAEGIKSVVPSSVFKCNFCSREMGECFPVVMKVCLGCVRKFMERGGGIKVVERSVFEDWRCEYCFGRTFSPLTINPFLCKSCSKKFGDRVKGGRKDLLAGREQDRRDKVRRGVLL
jgi:hypothetical protein